MFRFSSISCSASFWFLDGTDFSLVRFDDLKEKGYAG